MNPAPAASTAARLGDEDWIGAELLQIARADGDAQARAAACVRLVERSPDDLRVYSEVAKIAWQDKRPDVADACLSAARRKWARDERLALEWARLPARRGDWAEHVVRAEQIAREFPLSPEPALMQAKTEMARPEIERRNYASAVQRLRDFTSRFPDYKSGWRALLEALVGVGEFDEAEKAAIAIRARFPADAGLAAAHAGVLKQCGRAADAARVLETLPEGAAGHPSALKCIMLLCELGRFDEADRMCAAALKARPTADLAVEYARIARRRGESAEAVARWRAVADCSPDGVPIPGANQNDWSPPVATQANRIFSRKRLSNARVQAFTTMPGAPGEAFAGGPVFEGGKEDESFRHYRFGYPYDNPRTNEPYPATLRGEWNYLGPAHAHFGHVMAEMIHRVIPSLCIFRLRSLAYRQLART